MKDGKHIDVNRNERWWVNGKLHRTDGPAYISSGGTKEWWVNGKLHRTDGPAIVWPDGSQEWYLNGYKAEGDISYSLFLI